MNRADDPYKLGWRFWSRYLFQSAMVAAAVSVLTYLLKEPISWTRFLVWFVMGALMFIGPALVKHYRTARRQP